MTATPEGFLIAHNVPIARAGWYEYLGEELGLDDLRGQIVKVYRSPEEVFKPAAMASFEGKVATDEHPPEVVTPENATRYMRGAAQNVRQGSGGESDLLIADLVIYDQTLISEIQDGKREVSCGYDCTYVPMEDGTYQQQQICGNHVAVVTNGRAGDRVAIKDSKPNPEPEGETRMSKKIALPKKQSRVTDFLAALGLKQFALDAEPEDIREAVDAMAEERAANDENEETETKEETKDADPAMQALAEQVSKLTELVTGLIQANKAEPKPEDAIDAMIAELEKPTGDNDEEESHTIPVEQMDEEGPVTNPEDRPHSALTGDNAYKIAALKAMKPIIAAISDPTERKRAVDAAIASIKAKPHTNTYAAIDKGRKKPTADNQPASGKPLAQQDHSQLGKDIAAKYNPHYQAKA
ncbi:DUF2213 domain-containing protein [Paenibacillus foliorum]|nr:DUF2213 domain-containing protein [Paenibacillus foliorum]